MGSPGTRTTSRLRPTGTRTRASVRRAPVCGASRRPEHGRQACPAQTAWRAQDAGVLTDAEFEAQKGKILYAS